MPLNRTAKTPSGQTSQDYFEKIRLAFHAYCEKIRVETHQKLKEAGEDKEAQKAVLAEEKALLDKAFGELKEIVTNVNKDRRQRRERAEKRAENKYLGTLENEIQNL